MGGRMGRAAGRRVSVLVAMAAALALVGSGCWAQPGAGPAHTRSNDVESALNSGNVAGLEEVWSEPTAAWAYEPVIDGGRVVVSEDRRPNSGPLHVEAFSPATGERLWDRVLVDGGAQPVVSPVVIADGSQLLAFPASGCGAVTCSPVWTVTAPSNPPLLQTSFGSVTAGPGVLFVKTSYASGGGPVPTFGSEVRAYDPATGAGLGVTDLGGGTGVLAVRGSTIYYTQQPSSATNVVTVRAVDYCRDCATRFAPRWSAEIEATHFTAGVTIGGDVVYVAASTAGEGVVVALDADGCGAETCSPLGTVPITGFATDLSVSGGRVFAATTLGNGDDYALSALALP